MNRSNAIRRSAAGEDCTLRFPGSKTCAAEHGTTVACHLRVFQNGGAGMKPNDFEIVYGCFDCHNVLDGRAPRRFDDATFWRRIAFAMSLTQMRLYRKGLIKFHESKSRAQPVLSKVLPRRAA